MTSRRDFIKTTGMAAMAWPINHNTSIVQEKKIRIGIIGAENSHTAEYGRVFNKDTKFPGVSVDFVWGETEALALKAMQAGSIPKMVKDPLELMGKIDALIVDHRHAKFHLSAARPFLEQKIPIFIDKPFCYRADEGLVFLQRARDLKVPVTSYSAIAHSEATFELKEKVKTLGPLQQIVCTGPLDLDSEYGGVFFYGVHMIEPIMSMFGEDVTAVKITRQGHYGNAHLRFNSGLYATLIFKSKAYGWETYVETAKEYIELKPTVKETDPARQYVDMVSMFRTGVEPRPHQSILNGISILEALEKSSITEQWIDVAYVKI